MLNQHLHRPDVPELVEPPTAELLGQAPGKVPVLGADGRVPPRQRKGKPAAGKKTTTTKTPFNDPWKNPVDNSDLARVLIIGNSISIAYTPPVRRRVRSQR